MGDRSIEWEPDWIMPEIEVKAFPLKRSCGIGMFCFELVKNAWIKIVGECMNAGLNKKMRNGRRSTLCHRTKH